MSSITLPSQSFRSAQPLASGAAAHGLALAMTRIAAPLRSAVAATTRRLNAMGHDATVRALRERALAHLATDPSFAADLLAAADRYETTV